jgi:hypothetical protein
MERSSEGLGAAFAAALAKSRLKPLRNSPTQHNY